MDTPAGAAPPPNLRVLTQADWRSLERAGNRPEHALLRRIDSAIVRQLTDDELEALAVRREPATDGRSFEFVISTASEDRYRDTISVEGWDLSNFLRGGPGPMLWCHDHWTAPVAKSPAVRAVGPALVATAVFPTRDLHPFGFLIGELYAGQYMKAVSVGFDPLEWKYDEKRGGYDFLAQELLEFSAVNVPANPEALIIAGQKGLDLTPLDKWAREALDRAAGEAVLPVSKAKLEALVKALGFGRGVKFFDLSETEIRAKVRAKVRSEAVGDEPIEPEPAPEPIAAEGTVETTGAEADQVAEETPATDAELPAAESETPAPEASELSVAVELPDLSELRSLVERAEAVAQRLAPVATPEVPSPVVLRLSADPAQSRFRLDPGTVQRAMERAIAERFAPLAQKLTAVTGRIVQ